MQNRTWSRTFAISLMLSGLAILGALPAVALEGETFALTEVNFGDATITITNHGDADVDPNGLVVCNFPDYAPVSGAPTLAPGESTVVSLTAIGIPANASDGEMGLYLNNEFTDPNALVSYVEWGSSGHTRANVGMSAGVWDGQPVDPSGASGIGSSADFPTTGAAWSPLTAAQLPDTGLATGTLAAIGAALLLAGATVLLGSRTRQIARI